jgi:hypothetical protein
MTNRAERVLRTQAENGAGPARPTTQVAEPFLVSCNPHYPFDLEYYRRV